MIFIQFSKGEMLKEIAIAVGARPNFMKIPDVVKKLRKRGFVVSLVHSGQHYDKNMSKLFFDQLKIPKPTINLEVHSKNREDCIRQIRKKFGEFLKIHDNIKLVIVVGDCNTTIACAQGAKDAKIPIAHIESGLRSFNLKMPEETNRIETDKLSDIYFITEESAKKNLIREGYNPKKIFFVGNTMITTLLKNMSQAKENDIIKKMNLEKENYAVITMHRAENVDNPENLKKIKDILIESAKKIKIIFPMHPRTKKRFEEAGLIKQLLNEKIVITEPLGYLEFLNLMMNSKFIMTDSGGIQEEATILRKPCLTLRTETERPITVETGLNVIVGLNNEKIHNEISKIIEGRFINNVNIEMPKYWDTKVADRIADVIESYLF